MADEEAIAADEGLKDLVDEYRKVEEEESAPPDVSLEEAAAPAEEKSKVDPDEPSRELPETDAADEMLEKTPSSAADKKPPVADELTQQLASLAEDYGVDPEFLAGKFTSVDDAASALALLDQSYVAEAEEIQRRQHEAEAEYVRANAPAQQQQSQGEHQQTKEVEPPQAAPEAPSSTWSELDLADWDDDDALPKNLKGIDSNVNQLAGYVQLLKDEINHLVQERDYRAYDETMNRLNAVVDEKGMDLFGSSESLSQSQVDNRIKLFEQADVLVAGMRARNAPLPGEGQLVDRALRLAFGAETKQESAKAKSSSRRNSRRLGMPSRGTEKSVTDMALQHSGPLEENEAFLQLYRRMEDESS